MEPTLNNIHALIIDLDGVLWRGRTFLPGIVEFFQFLRDPPLPFILATNNATATPLNVVQRLEGAGVRIEEKEVLSSAAATTSFLLERIPPGSPVYAIGEAAVQESLKSGGFELSEHGDDVRAVVVGYDREINYQKLLEGTLGVNSGALFVGTNPDVSFPMERGEAPGNGAIVALIETATGVPPIFVGKPEPHLFLQARQLLGIPPEEILAIGDRLETDILGAQRAGMPSGLVLTGVTDRAALEKSSIQPDWIFEDLAAIIQHFSE